MRKCMAIERALNYYETMRQLQLLLLPPTSFSFSGPFLLVSGETRDFFGIVRAMKLPRFSWGDWITSAATHLDNDRFGEEEEEDDDSSRSRRSTHTTVFKVLEEKSSIWKSSRNVVLSLVNGKRRRRRRVPKGFSIARDECNRPKR